MMQSAKRQANVCRIVDKMSIRDQCSMLVLDDHPWGVDNTRPDFLEYT